MPEILLYMCFSKPCKTWIFNKGFNLSSQLLAAVPFDVFLSFPLFVFFFIYSITFLWLVFLQAVSECTLLWVEKREKKAIFPPLRLLLWFPKVVGRQLLSACRRVSSGCHIFQPVHLSWLLCLHLGRQCLCLLPLSRRSVQLWSKWELICGLLMPPCFVFSLLWSRLGSVDGALSLQCLKVESNPGAPDTRSPTSLVGWWGGCGSGLSNWGACRCVLTRQEPARCSGLCVSVLRLCELTGVCDWHGCRLRLQSECWSTSLGFLLLGW